MWVWEQMLETDINNFHISFLMKLHRRNHYEIFSETQQKV